MAITAHLEIEAGAAPQRFEVPEAAAEITIGRSADCQWVIPSGAVSRRHAVLRRRGDELVVEDLGSSNGTMVNGERLSGPRTLRDQDKLQLGAVEIRVLIPEPAADATIALDATRRLSPEPAQQQTSFAASPSPQHSGKTATAVVPPPLPAQSAEPPNRAPSPAPPSRPTPAPSAPPSSVTPFAATPSARKAVASVPTSPSMLELAVIAAGTFLVVFGIGAALIRFVF
jgi:predicted component of type VI protein secretion system